MVNIGLARIGNIASKYEVKDFRMEILPSICFLSLFSLLLLHFSLYCFVNLLKSFSAAVKRLSKDGVGPVDNTPSTNKLHHFVQKKKKNDMGHVTRDT